MLTHLPVIAFTDTSAEPHTVMVKVLDTVIARGTMTWSRRPKYETSLTEFHLEAKSRLCL